jgi:two-component system NtrC family sensor kinase
VPTLHVLQGPDKGRVYQPPRDEPALIGRTSDQIQLRDHGVSRKHALLRPSNGAWVISDLNSSNGTYVNGQRLVSAMVLHHGDQIKVGASLMVFSGEDRSDLIAGPERIRDHVDLELGSRGVDSSILHAVDAGAESVILQAPETADAVAAWNVVYRVAEMIGTSVTVEDFLERVCDVVFAHLLVDRLVLLMHNPTTGELEPQIVRYRQRRAQERAKIITSQRIIEHVLKSRDGVLCANAMNDARFTEEDSTDSIHRLGLRSVICVPVIAHEDVMGVFHMDCSMSHHTYTQEQLRLAVAIGRLTGMAVENTRLLAARMRHERLAATGQTVAFLSHHIRNILQGLQSGADIIELGLRRQKLDVVSGGWEIVRRNLDRTFYLTMNMLTFSKQRQPRIESVQLNRIIEDVVQLAQRRADEKSVMLLLDLDDLPPAPLDAEGIHQVVLNIVLNAVDAVQEHEGRINIRSEWDGPGACVVVRISDNGPGIDADTLPQIFEAFHSSKGHGGTGLGLAAAKKIVEELNGTIQVESGADEGTTFIVRIPATDVRLADSDQTHGPS